MIRGQRRGRIPNTAKGFQTSLGGVYSVHCTMEFSVLLWLYADLTPHDLRVCGLALLETEHETRGVTD